MTDDITIDEPVRRWHVMAGLMQSQGYKSFVEVGCKDGRTSAFVAEHCPDASVTAIDPWKPMPHKAGVDCGETYSEWDFGQIEAEFKERCAPFKNVTHLRMTSREAVAAVPESDLIFLDALHDEASVLEDIGFWWPKVRPGGILAGHDYNGKQRGVLRAVAATFCLMDVGLSPDSVWFIQVPA